MTKIASLYAERLMSDLILVVGKQELPAHRLILCASSEVFQVLVFVPFFCLFSYFCICVRNWPVLVIIFVHKYIKDIEVKHLH